MYQNVKVNFANTFRIIFKLVMIVFLFDTDCLTSLWIFIKELIEYFFNFFVTEVPII